MSGPKTWPTFPPTSSGCGRRSDSCVTADERASKIVTDADWWGTDWVYDGTSEVPQPRVDTGILHAQIAAAIRDAEAAAKADMRERAARVAEQIADGRDFYSGGEAEAIAAAVRALE
jgi:hypothetical protein